jgi:signal peptidase I
VSPPSGLPRDGHDDAPGGNGARPRSDLGPRHLAGAPAASGEEGDGGDTVTSRGGVRRTGSSAGRMVLEWVAVIGCGVLIALTAQAFLVQAFWIPSPSMTPTLEVGDRVLVNKLSYRAHDVRRGDLVVFERPPQASSGAEGEIKDLIKRVVAVGGDTLEGHDGDVYVNGERIDEPYLAAGTPTDNLPRQEIPEGHVFVMGDNRQNSEDSRVFGPVAEDTIVGRAVVKVLPLSDVGWL